ncbi:PAS domain S-box protein, partial [Geminocystis sp. GBBB08]|uniref:PAS domain-containing protein n=1 Tax=Geminocystis sp. GBBB08 TaxID=2604140 RepID=UPI0027E3B089
MNKKDQYLHKKIKNLQKENKSLKKQLQIKRKIKVKLKNQLAKNIQDLNLTIVDKSNTLKKIENKYNHFFKLSLNLFCIADTNGYFLEVNSAWEKLLGYNTEELTSNQFFYFIHPEDQEKTQRELNKIKSGEKIRNFENRYRCKDGSYRWLLWTSILVSTENVIYATANDITERKLAEEKLYLSKEELRLILDSLPIGISYIDNQRRYRFVNRLHEIWQNSPRDQIIGKYVWEKLGKESYENQGKFL